MANNDRRINKKNVNSLARSVSSSLSNLYKNTFFTTDTNRRDLENIQKNIDDSLDKITVNTISNTGDASISKVYSRLKDSNKGNDKNIEEMFNDQKLTDSLMSNFEENKYLRDLDEEIDTVCKYMPSLEDALDAKKDNVLSADHFSKDFLNVINTTDTSQTTVFGERIKALKDKYDLIEFIDQMYSDTAKYGETFIYCVEYEKAINKLLKAKQDPNMTYIANESADLLNNNGVITESFEYDYNKNTLNQITDNMIDESNISISIELDGTGVLQQYVNETTRAVNILTESSKKNVFDTTIKDNNYEGFEGDEKNTGVVDGLTDQNAQNEKSKPLNAPGCVLKKLPRENVIPLYIENICLGYYILEVTKKDPYNISRIFDPIVNNKSMKASSAFQDAQLKDQMLVQLAAKLSSMIDEKFIRSNQDLSREIYMILKHNDMFNVKSSNQLRVTFVPPEDMIHMHFRLDPDTHRGISDLDKSMVPAKLFTSIYVTDWLGILTRSQDKRVYYVKQNIDSNISKVLLNTINQIKRGNFGARELTNVKTLLNITGKFNDYIIPMNNSGEAPMQFEVMEGQKIDIQTELLDILEQMAVNATDVPFEYVQSRKSVDYAVRLTMSSGKFLRKVFKRQCICEQYFSPLITKLYNSEYNEQALLRVELPPPSFLNLINTNNVVAQTNENVQGILDMEMANEQDEDVKAIFARNLKRYYLGQYFDMKQIQDIKQRSIIEAQTEQEMKMARENINNSEEQ